MLSITQGNRAGADSIRGGGQMGERIRQYDWSKHPLGPIDGWPQSLKIAIRIMLTSRYAMWMAWGPEFYFFCNDAYLPTVGMKESWVLGASAKKVWEEIWADIGPRAEWVVATGKATWDESLLLFLERSGYVEETYHTFSYSPLPDDDGNIGGMLCVVTEETERVIGERRLAFLKELGAVLAEPRTEESLFKAMRGYLASQARDVPFALVYLFDDLGSQARLACAHEATPGSVFAPSTISLRGDGPSLWPALEVYEQKTPVGRTVNLSGAEQNVPRGPWDRAARQAVVAPIAQQGQDRPAGFLVAGINPYRPLDAAYQGFVNLLAGQLAAAWSNVRAYEEARKRAEALAELDRAKTTFFSNVSHELRTPLTLMLGPLEDMMDHPDRRNQAQGREMVTVAHRNGLRLLKLVNTLLDFSRIEAGRIQASFEPLDLASFTRQTVETFRPVMEKAGLHLVVHCPDLSQQVYVDREMWEKIVLNLVSNAFKFTLRGDVEVRLEEAGDTVRLTVRDSGIGIPADAMPHLFERFYRVQGAAGRTHEGTGIGLALVHELARLHSGSVHAESKVNQGSVFTVFLKHGTAHLPQDRVLKPKVQSSTGVSPVTFVEEAFRWLPDSVLGSNFRDEDDARKVLNALPMQGRGRVLLVDDNADMRQYVARLLADRFDVITAADGEEALALARMQRPDLVLSDVMMPKLDGYGLLKQLRKDPALSDVPVILLSARAGEEARLGGLDAGADDYLTKPFSSRELVARVKTHLELARERRQTSQRVRQILDSVTDGFIAFDPQWRITYFNRHTEERIMQLRKVPSDILGKVFWEEFPVARGTRLEAVALECMKEQKPHDLEYFSVLMQSWLELHFYPSPDGLSVFYRDITEEKNAAHALRDREERLRHALTAAHMGSWRVNLQNGRAIHDASLNRILGQEASTTGGLLHDRFSMVHPEDRAQVRAAWNEAVENNGFYLAEFRMLHPDGGMRWLREQGRVLSGGDGRPDFMTGVTMDITDKKEAEQQLKDAKDLLEERVKERTAELAEANAKYQAMYDQGVFAGLITPDGTLVDANRSSLSTCGFSREDVIGKPFWETGWWNRSAEVQTWLKHGIAEARAGRPFHGESIYFTADGTERIGDFALLPLKDESGKVIYVLPTGLDITERKHAEKERRKYEAMQVAAERFRFMADHAPVMVWQSDTSQECVWFNQVWLDFVGRPMRLEMGSGWTDNVHPDDLAHCLAVYRRAFRGRSTFEVEYRQRRYDDVYRWIMNRGVPMYEADGSFAGYIGSSIDITERREAADTIRTTAERLAYELAVSSAVNASLGEGVLMVNEDGAITYMNPAAESMLGWSIKELAGQKMEDKIHHPAWAQAQPNWHAYPAASAMETGEIVRSEGVFTRNDGTHFAVSCTASPIIRGGRVTGATVVFHDITERNRSVEALAAHARRAELLSQTAADLLMAPSPRDMLRSIFERLARELRVEFYLNYFVTPSGDKLVLESHGGLTDAQKEKLEHLDFGQALCGTCARCATPIILTDVQHSTWDAAKEMKELGIQVYACHPLLVGDQLLGTLSFGSSTRTRFDEEELRFIHTICDLVAASMERARLLHELRHALDAAQQASRAKDDFLAALSHELRTPLNPVLLLSSEGSTNDELPENVRSDFGTIAKNVALEARLIDDLLDLTRITRGKLVLELSAVNVHNIVQDAVSTVSRELEEKSIHLSLDLLAPQPIVKADHVRLQQIFWNVLKNAIKFTPREGQVRVASRVIPDRGVIEVRISDSGIGLTSAELKSVFNAFAQGEHAANGGSHRFGGLGLGLTITRMLTELHSGTIHAESSGRNKGATFILELPLLAESSIPAHLNSPTDGAPVDAENQVRKLCEAEEKPKILVVEDHEPTRVALSILLKRRKYDVVTAASVAEALEAAAKGGVGLVISDIGLPDGTGHELMMILRERYGLKGIALTGYGSEEDVARSEASGFITHLTKPVRVQSLEVALSSAWGRKAAQSS